MADGSRTLSFALIGDVAQLGERLVCNQEVAGSIPVVSIPLATLSQLVNSTLPLSSLRVMVMFARLIPRAGAVLV